MCPKTDVGLLLYSKGKYRNYVTVTTFFVSGFIRCLNLKSRKSLNLNKSPRSQNGPVSLDSVDVAIPDLWTFLPEHEGKYVLRNEVIFCVL